ncbi:MAG TPA: HAMP domain-containing sensor histidine kinase [Hyphomicrobiaceae bacterium]|nr:HAMP domain-containing sensor histidine kinase [Hyphomicrobiaceae bacterium]
MAWTSSAGPEGTFALADGADGPVSLSKSTADTDRPESGLVRPFAYATLAHLFGLVAIAPFADNNPILAIPAIIGVSISYLTLSHPSTRQRNQPSTRTSPAAISAQNDETEFQFTVSSDNRNVVTMPMTANLDTQPYPIIAIPLSPSEVPSDLRAELMARVSHELRTPLNAVMGFSDLMGHQLFGPLGHPRYEEYVSHIRESSQKLLKSAEDTLAMTSLMAKSAGGCEREPLTLSHLCKEANAVVASDLERRGIACIIDVEAGIEVIAHRRALRQALVNVICEAIALTDEGGTVTIHATSDLDRVALLVVADRLAPRSPEEHRSLPLCLARTLLELDGCQLYESTTANAPWSVLLSLDGAIQQELFATSHAV